MASVTGTVEPPVSFPAPGGTPVDATLEVQLCGFGSQIPRNSGTSLMGRITEQNITVNANGTFTFGVVPNDQIAPAGTYYTVTVMDGNGDVAQVNAYRFTGAGPFDLNSVPPYDPNQPPPSLPPLITNLLLILAASYDMVFDGTNYTAFKTTLPGDVTAPVFQNMVPGNLYTFIIVQDATGGHTFAWPSNVHNATLVDPAPNSTTVQTFIADDNEVLWAIGPGTWSQ